MQTIGKLIKDARLKKRYSLKKIEEETKIKRVFVEAIEKENWKDLPDFPVISGFVKSLSSILGINEKKATAVLRRDFPPKTALITPKPDLENKFIWTPRFTFLSGVFLVILLFLGYIFFQYKNFISPPNLIVNTLSQNQEVSGQDLVVSGRADPDAVVLVNNQPALVDSNGNFTTTIKINKDTKEIEIKAVSRSGRETVIHRTIKPE